MAIVLAINEFAAIIIVTVAIGSWLGGAIDKRRGDAEQARAARGATPSLSVTDPDIAC